MIIGYPTLLKWGYAIEEDDDGNVFIELRKLGMRLLAAPKGRVRRNVVAAHADVEGRPPNA